MGGETVAVAQKAYLVTWFSSDELNLVFGFIASSALLGSSLNQLVMEPIYKYINSFESGAKCLGIAITLASITVIFSSICAFILSPLDKRRTKYLRIDLSNKQLKSYKDQFRDTINLFFNLKFWLIILICVTFYSATFPFISLGKLFFIKKYEISNNLSALQQSLFFFSTVITSPLFGKIVDWTGYNLLWVILSILAALLSHVLLMFTYLNSLLPVLIMGMSLSLLYASLWPMVALIVPKAQLGTAYGIMQCFQNLGLAVFTLLTGFLVENYGYYVLELFFVDLCLIGLVVSILLYFIDKSNHGNLCISKKEMSEIII